MFPTLIAAGTAPAFFTEAVALIVAGAVIAYISFRLKLVPIVGFLLAGVLIGPNAIGLVRDQALVDATAEIGVILLLFTIGIEFSLEKLAKIQRLILGGGMMQVGLSIMLTTAVLFAFGLDWKTGVFTGMLVALSSTAIVLKLLADRGETNSEPGQIGLGLLIFQDLAIVVMVMLVPVLAGGEGGGSLDIIAALVKAGAIIAAVLIIARRIMPRILETVAKTCSPELFLLTVIAICFGTAFLTSLAGVSLSLGAFLAGLMVSESRFSHHALSETLPLQILFSATFFVSVGMLLDVSYLIQHLPMILAAVVAVLLIKVATTGFSVLALGYKTQVAAASALMLAQIGEFSFVLERTGREAGLFPLGTAAGSQTFIAATVVLMVATPGLMSFGTRLSERMKKKHSAKSAAAMQDEIPDAELELEDHVIVAGYGQAARHLVRVLSGSGIPFVITTLSPDGANEAEAEGLPVIRGDATRSFLLRHVGIDRAKMLVIADDDPATAHRITSVARGLNPTMRIVVRTRYTAEVDKLAAAGADGIIAEELESIVQLFGEVLRDYRVVPAEIEKYEDLARRNGYSALFDPEADNSVFKCQTGEDCFDTRTVNLRTGVPIIGRTLAEVASSTNGISVKRLERGGHQIMPLVESMQLEAGDEVELSGPTEVFARNAAMFRPAPPKAFEAAAFVSPSTIQRPEITGFIDTHSQIVFKPAADSSVCSHLAQIRPVYPSATGCEDCLRTGDKWVHLRICLTCGHVGCCDTSANKHAAAHFHSTNHPIIRSMQPNEDWAWCFSDEDYV
jgi:CPA2 family monovalent cation:H+ antiporter-2